MESNGLKKTIEDMFSTNNEYFILKKENVLRLKEAIEELTDTYNYPRIRKNLHNRDDVMECHRRRMRCQKYGKAQMASCIVRIVRWTKNVSRCLENSNQNLNSTKKSKQIVISIEELILY